MKIISQKQFLKVVQLYFGDDLKPSCRDQLSIEQAYDSIRTALLTPDTSSTVPTEPLRFPSKALQDDHGEMDMTRLEYQ